MYLITKISSLHGQIFHSEMNFFTRTLRVLSALILLWSPGQINFSNVQQCKLKEKQLKEVLNYMFGFRMNTCINQTCVLHIRN